MLEYCTIFARKTRDVSDLLESARRSKRKEAQIKVDGQRHVRIRDTSKWRIASFQNVFREDYTGKACKDFGAFEKRPPL